MNSYGNIHNTNKMEYYQAESAQITSKYISQARIYHLLYINILCI